MRELDICRVGRRRLFEGWLGHALKCQAVAFCRPFPSAFEQGHKVMPWQADLELSPTLESRTNKKGRFANAYAPSSVSDSKVFQMSALELDSFTTSFMSLHLFMRPRKPEKPLPIPLKFATLNSKAPFSRPMKSKQNQGSNKLPIPTMQILGRLVIIGWSDRGIFAAWPWEDMFIAHIGGMDCLARGLIGACKLVQEGLMKKALESRPSPWDNGNETLHFWETWQNLFQRRASLDYWNQDQEKDCSQDKGAQPFSASPVLFPPWALENPFFMKKTSTRVTLVEKNPSRIEKRRPARYSSFHQLCCFAGIRHGQLQPWQKKWKRARPTSRKSKLML